MTLRKSFLCSGGINTSLGGISGSTHRTKTPHTGKSAALKPPESPEKGEEL